LTTILRWFTALTCTVFVATAAPLPARAAERLSDKQLDALIENIDKGFDKWKDALEKRNYDDAVITSAAGTINVKQFLRDFEKDIDTLKDRVSDTYAANTEAASLLRRASDVDKRYVERQGQGVGASEWAALGTQFGALAASYGAPWPTITDGTGIGRLTDKQMATQLKGVEASAKRLADDASKAGKNKSVDQAAVSTVKDQCKLIGTYSKNVGSRVKDGRPASGEVAQLLAATRAAGQAASKLPLSPVGGTAWSSLDQSAAALARAFGQPWTTMAR
jgi:hypothetical protein